jgi:hypothetical protein
MFENRKIDFVNELIRRFYIYNNLQSTPIKCIYARNYGAYIINLTMENVNIPPPEYEICCTVKFATSDQVAFKFSVYDKDILIPELVNSIEEKAKVYWAIVKFVEA